MKHPVPVQQVWLVALGLWCLPLRAGVPEPDNLVYGTIVLDNVQVTAARTDVTVEARRLIDGPPVASYRMGSSSQTGSFYALRIPLESGAPLLDPNASLAGDSLFIVVLDTSGVRAQASYTVGGRAATERLDFGAAVADSDGDGLPDAWETLNFGNLDQGPNSISPNGQTALQNYIAGTNPNDTNSTFSLRVDLTNGLGQVSFSALRAEGIGYEGMSRYYSLEYSTNAGGIPWLPVDGYTNLLGNNQTVIYEAVGTNAAVFYRGSAWLQGP